MASRRHAGENDRGAVLLEAAVIAPFFLLIVFAIIDFAFVYNQKLSMHQATSAGARKAAVTTSPSPPGGGSWSPSNCDTTGIATSGDGYNLICYTKQLMGLDPSQIRVSVNFAAPWTLGQEVTFCTQYPVGSVTGALKMFLGGIQTSKTVIRIEQPSSSFTAPVRETPLPGTSWPESCTLA